MIERGRVADLGRLVVEVISETAAFNNDLKFQKEQDMQRFNGRPFLA